MTSCCRFDQLEAIFDGILPITGTGWRDAGPTPWPLSGHEAFGEATQVNPPHHQGGLVMPHEGKDRDAARRQLLKALATAGAAATGETGGVGRLVAQPQTRGGDEAMD